MRIIIYFKLINSSFAEDFISYTSVVSHPWLSDMVAIVSASSSERNDNISSCQWRINFALSCAWGVRTRSSKKSKTSWNTSIKDNPSSFLIWLISLISNFSALYAWSIFSLNVNTRLSHLLIICSDLMFEPLNEVTSGCITILISCR